MSEEIPTTKSAYNTISARVLYRLAPHRRGKYLDDFIESFLVPMEGGYESFEWADAVLRRLFAVGYLTYANGRFLVTEEFRRQFPPIRKKERTFTKYKQEIARFRATLNAKLPQEKQAYPALPKTIWNEEIYEQAIHRAEQDSKRGCYLSCSLILIVIAFILALFFRPFVYVPIVMLFICLVQLLEWQVRKRSR